MAVGGDPFFWVGDTNTDWNTANNWATTSGGVGGTVAGAPDSNSDVEFDNGSAVNCTIGAALNPAVSKFTIASNYAGTFDMNGNDISVDGGDVSIDDTSATITWDGKLLVGGSLILTSTINLLNLTINSGVTISGTIVMTGDLEFITGTYSITGGTLEVEGDIILGQTSLSGTTNITWTGAGTTPTISGSGAYTGSGTFTINGAVTFTVTGTVTTPGDLVITLATTINGGVLSVTGDITLTDTTVAGTCDLQMAGSSGTISGAGDIPAGGDLIFNNASGTFAITMSGTIPNALTITAATTVTVTGTVNVTGLLTLTSVTTLNGGLLSVGGGVTLSDATVAGTCDIDMTAGTLSGAGTAPSGGDFRFNGAVTFTVTGSPTVGNCEILLATTINGGTVQVNGNLTLTDASVTGTCDFSMVGVSGSDTIAGAGDIPASGSLIFNNVSGNYTVTGTVSVPALLITGASNINGGLLSVSGNVTLNDADLVGSCGIDMTGTGTLSGSGRPPTGGDFRFNGNVTFTVSGTMTLINCEILSAATINGGTVEVSGDLTLTDVAVNGSCDFILTGTGALSGAGVPPGSGLFSFNTGSGTTTVTGTVTLPNLTITTAGTINGGLLSVSGNVILTGTGVTGTTDIDMTAGGVSTLSGAGQAPSGGDFRFNGVGTVTTSGSPTVGNCEILDATTLNGGTVQVNGDLTLTDTTVAGTTNIAMIGATGTLSGAGDIPASGDLTFNNAAGVFTVTGTIPVPNALIITAAATINGGTLQVNGDITLTDASVTGTCNVEWTNSTGTGTLSGAGQNPTGGTFTINGTVTGAETFTVTGTVEIGGDLIITEAATINGGALSVLGNITLTDTGVAGTCSLIMIGATGTLSGAGDIPAGGDLTFNNAAGVFTVTGTISVPNALIITAAATINGGTLQANGDITFTDASVTGTCDIEWLAAGTLSGSGTAPTGGLFTFNAAATFVIAAAPSFNDLTITLATTINGGSMTIAGNIILTDATVNGTCTVTWSSAGTGTLTTGGTGKFPDGDVTIAGGTLTLSGALDLDGTGQDLNINTGTFNINGNDLTVTGDITVAASGTLRLKGDETVAPNALVNNGTISYFDTAIAVTFNDLTTSFNNIVMTKGKTYRGTIGTTIIIAGNVTFPGTGTILLESTVAGTQFFLNSTKDQSWDTDISVRDCDADDGARQTAIGGTNRGNNDNWFFSSVPVVASDTNWMFSARITFTNNTERSVSLIKDTGASRAIAKHTEGNVADLVHVKRSNAVKNFVSAMGYDSSNESQTSAVNDVVFRFTSNTPNGNYIGTNDEIIPTIESDNLAAVLSVLRKDSDFIDLMADLS